MGHADILSGWLAEQGPDVRSPAGLFLEEQREDGLAGLPRAAVIHAAETPRGTTAAQGHRGARV
jgi:hypothetical protein